MFGTAVTFCSASDVPSPSTDPEGVREPDGDPSTHDLPVDAAQAAGSSLAGIDSSRCRRRAEQAVHEASGFPASVRSCLGGQGGHEDRASAICDMAANDHVAINNTGHQSHPRSVTTAAATNKPMARGQKASWRNQSFGEEPGSTGTAAV